MASSSTRITRDVVDRPDPPLYTHPFAALCARHRLYFILLNYASGYESGRGTALQVLNNEKWSNSKGMSLFDVFGEHDLLIRILLEPSRLQMLLKELRTLDPPPEKVIVYRVAQVSTAAQRLLDEDLAPPLTLEQTIIRDGKAWRINKALQDPIARTRNPTLVKFFAFFLCDDYSQAARVFRDLLASCAVTAKNSQARNERMPFENYAVYSLRGDRCGCLLTGYTRNWQEMQPAFIRLLKRAEISKLKSTTLIRASEEDVEDDQPASRSLRDRSIVGLASLRLEAVLTILDIDELTSEKSVRDSFTHVFDQEKVGNSVVAYDPRFWWRYVDELRELCSDIARHRNRRVLAFLMLAYTRIEAELRTLVLAHYTVTKNGKLDGQKLAYEVMTDCGILEYDKVANRAKDALTAYSSVREVKGLPKELQSTIKASLGETLRCFKSLARKDAHITMGVIPRILQEFAERGIIPKETYDTALRPQMGDWGDNLRNASEDRNRLMHGDILNIYEARNGDRAAWQGLLANYVRVYPQVQWIIQDLSESLELRRKAQETEDANE